MDRRYATILLLCILLTGFVLRAAPVRTGHHYWDETVYLQGGEIVAGDRPADTYHEFDIRPPLLFVLAGAVFALGGSVTVVHLILAGIAALGIPLVYILGRELYSSEVGLLAAAGYAVAPEHVFFSHLISIDPVMPVLWTAAALLWLYSWRRDDTHWAAAAGVICGLAALAKFTSLVLPAALLAVGFVARLDAPVRTATLYDAVRRTLHDGRSWALGLAAGAVFVPYLGWQFVTFGDPFFVFKNAVAVVNADTPFLTYVTGAPELLPLVFLAGLVLFVPRLRQWDRLQVSLPVLVSFALFVPLQFGIANKEVRYLLPIIGLLAIMAAAGFTSLKYVTGRKAYVAVAVIVLAISAQPVLSHDYGRMVQDGRYTFADAPSEAHQAAVWVKDNTPENVTVYANDRWPIIAWYSERRVRIVPAGAAHSWAAVDAVEKPGYVVFTEHGADWGGPEQYLLDYSPWYRTAAEFGDVTVYRVVGP